MTTQKQLLHTPVQVTLAGETFDIKPFPFGKIHQVSAKLLPVFSSLQMEAGQALDLGELLASGGEGLMETLALAINRPRSFLDEISYDEGRELLAAVMAANADLVKKALPDLIRLMTGQAPAKTV